MDVPDHKLPAAYLEGVRLFNSREFFDCHDVLEELWSETIGEETLFYQGLIQAAVVLFHFENGNLGGARKMYESSRKLLAPYTPKYHQMNVTKFQNAMRFCFRDLLTSDTVYPSGVELEESTVPAIELDSNNI